MPTGIEPNRAPPQAMGRLIILRFSKPQSQCPQVGRPVAAPRSPVIDPRHCRYERRNRCPCRAAQLLRLRRPCVAPDKPGTKPLPALLRSEERRVGKECRCVVSPYDCKKNAEHM